MAFNDGPPGAGWKVTSSHIPMILGRNGRGWKGMEPRAMKANVESLGSKCTGAMMPSSQRWHGFIEYRGPRSLSVYTVMYTVSLYIFNIISLYYISFAKPHSASHISQRCRNVAGSTDAAIRCPEHKKKPIHFALLHCCEKKPILPRLHRLHLRYHKISKAIQEMDRNLIGKCIRVLRSDKYGTTVTTSWSRYGIFRAVSIL